MYEYSFIACVTKVYDHASEVQKSSKAFGGVCNFVFIDIMNYKKIVPRWEYWATKVYRH